MYEPETTGRTAIGKLTVACRGKPPQPPQSLSAACGARAGDPSRPRQRAGRCERARAPRRDGWGLRRARYAHCSRLCWRSRRLYFALPPPALDRSRSVSVLVLARDGSILRGFLSADGKWRLPVEPDNVDPLYRRMLVAAEDARFDGIPASTRSPRCAPRRSSRCSGHVVSGASTLTMQVVRLLERAPALARGKARRDGEGAGARTPPVEGRGARPLSDPGPVRRQSRRRAGGEPGLFRQGAARICRRRSARCWSHSALAGAAAPGPPPRGGARRPRRGPRAAWPRRASSRPPTLAEARAEKVPRRPARHAVPRAASGAGIAQRGSGRAEPSHDDRPVAAAAGRGAAEARGRWRSIPRPRSPRWSSTIATGGCWPMSATPISPSARAARDARHGARGALAGLGAEAVHLCDGVRPADHPSGDRARRPAAAFRRLRAHRFRRPFPGRRERRARRCNIR